MLLSVGYMSDVVINAGYMSDVFMLIVGFNAQVLRDRRVSLVSAASLVHRDSLDQLEHLASPDSLEIVVSMDSPERLDRLEVPEVRAIAAVTGHPVQLDLPAPPEMPDSPAPPDLPGLLKTAVGVAFPASQGSLGIPETRDQEDFREVWDNQGRPELVVGLETREQLVGLALQEQEATTDDPDLQAAWDLLEHREVSVPSDLVGSRVMWALLAVPARTAAVA